jgi:glycosyltransferase involved in cell wall biosynthesis
MLRLSVVIPAYNQDELILDHVTACAAARRLPDEVIVVDDCGKPGLREKLASRDWPFPLIVIRVLKDIPWNQSGARNIGWTTSIGDVISFEDADHFPQPSYYSKAIELFHMTAATLVRSTRVMGSHVLPAPQGVCVIRRIALAAVGGYDEDFCGHYGYEDCLLLRQLRQHFPNTFRAIKRETRVIEHGSTRVLDRDTTRNKKLLQTKLTETMNSGSIIRFPYQIAISTK